MILSGSTKLMVGSFTFIYGNVYTWPTDRVGPARPKLDRAQAFPPLAQARPGNGTGHAVPDCRA
jgi:hypothetical protein